MFGFLVTLVLVFCGFMKWLRSDALLWWLLIATIILATIGVINRVPENPRLNSWDGLTGPLVYVSAYALLRWLYKSIYRREPTYMYASRYDWEDRRKLDALDYVVHVGPTLLALFTPAVLTKILG